MSGERIPVELILLWHHHQPDYRSAVSGGSLLPWVRLHATKDYLDMALRLERHPTLRATFNFVPSLLDQLEEAGDGAPDTLFDALARDPGELGPAERDALAQRLRALPPHARERWPELGALAARTLPGAARPLADAEWVALEAGFLLAWLDPMFLDRPEAADALAHRAAPGLARRDALLALHARLLREVIPAYRALAERGQIELSASAYYHPILPLLIDTQVARRALPAIALPAESFAAPEDAAAQLQRGRARHARAFGALPIGAWPSEGSVSPETIALLAAQGVQWAATDEGVLWRSRLEVPRERASLHQPWRVASPAGDVTLFFRDHELSDRIGFVYHRWGAAEAAADFVERVRRIAREAPAGATPVVTVALDGENCWESYPLDGGPFLDALYAALEGSPDIRTVTPADVIAARRADAVIAELHSGSWIDADFHIWIGHPEKNRAWDLLARTRRALRDSGATPATEPAAFEHLYAAEGSDWFWWFGDDHYTEDRGRFDRLFREHLQAVFTVRALAAPEWLLAPIVGGAGAEAFAPPIGLVSPTLDGRDTQFYEWHHAGRIELAGGSAMHRGERILETLAFGFDLEAFALRAGFAAGPPGAHCDLVVEWSAPRRARVTVHGLIPGDRPVSVGDGQSQGDGARSVIDAVLELRVPFATLGMKSGQRAEFEVRLEAGGSIVETVPPAGVIHFDVPDANFERRIWSA